MNMRNTHLMTFTKCTRCAGSRIIRRIIP